MCLLQQLSVQSVSAHVEVGEADGSEGGVRPGGGGSLDGVQPPQAQYQEGGSGVLGGGGVPNTKLKCLQVRVSKPIAYGERVLVPPKLPPKPPPKPPPKLPPKPPPKLPAQVTIQAPPQLSPLKPPPKLTAQAPAQATRPNHSSKSPAQAPAHATCPITQFADVALWPAAAAGTSLQQLIQFGFLKSTGHTHREPSRQRDEFFQRTSVSLEDVSVRTDAAGAPLRKS